MNMKGKPGNVELEFVLSSFISEKCQYVRSIRESRFLRNGTLNEPETSL